MAAFQRSLRLKETLMTRTTGNPTKSVARSGVTRTGVVVGILLVALLVLLIPPAIQQSREGERRTQCRNRLKLLVLGLQNYHDLFQSFPPAYTIDPLGSRLQSWRLHVLPHVEQVPFSNSQVWEPVTSERNSRFYRYDLMVFACPSDLDRVRCETDYMVAHGEQCVFQGIHSRSLKEIEDGASNTLLISEVIETGVHWMQPIDLPFEDFTGFGHAGGFRSKHTGGIQAVMADGSVRWFNVTTDPIVQRALLTANGGETISEF